MHVPRVTAHGAIGVGAGWPKWCLSSKYPWPPCIAAISPALVTSLSPGHLDSCCSRKGHAESPEALCVRDSHDSLR